MQIYSVGGAVRDALLGLPVKDRDFVVVGATPDAMVALGFTPVGKDFPVFLHPQTHEEYALARTERKTAPGYKGFVFHADGEVTLEQDLIRRDLTINAIAQAEDGTLVDPFGGQQDLHDRVFRHVSEAFAEDPVRILRVARFAARFTDFTVAAETNALMRQMVASGEVDALVPERVWQELSRGLMEAMPSRMFAVLRDCDALARLLPELEPLWHVPQPVAPGTETEMGGQMMRVIDYAASQQLPLPIRLAALLQHLGLQAMPVAESLPQQGVHARSVELVEAVCSRLKIPIDCRQLAIMAAREHDYIRHAFELSAAEIVSLIERCDGWRRPQRFLDLLRANTCDHDAGAASAAGAFVQSDYLSAGLNVAKAVDAGVIAQQFKADPQRIPDAVRAARIAAVSQLDVASHNEATRR